MAYRILFPRAYLCKVSYLPLPLDSDGKPVPVTGADSPITMPGIDDPVPENWVTQTGRYFIVYAINIPLLDPMTLLSPDSRYVPLILFDIIVCFASVKRKINALNAWHSISI